MSTPSAPRAAPSTLYALVGSAVAMSALSIYEWVELFTVRAGGKPACAINETVDCAAVWNSKFASDIHATFGMPVAATGLVWGLSATLLGLVLLLRTQRDEDTSIVSAAVKLWGIAGALSSVVLGVVAFRTGAVCIACIGTYLTVLTYWGVGAFKLPGGTLPSSNTLIPGIGWCLAVGAASFLMLIYPGQRTPKANEPVMQGGHEAAEVFNYLNNMPQQAQLATSLARAEYLRSPQPDISNFTTRNLRGPSNAPVRIVDFTDIRCGHCRSFEEVSNELFNVVPKGRIAIEPRYFPLDGQCNREVKQKGNDNVRCLGAKVQICLESNPKFWDVRHQLFTNQETLTEAKIIEFALAAGVGRDDLLRCVDSMETQSKIDADVAYAMKYGIDGTPLVLVNGRRTLPIEPFLLGMAMSNGDVNAPYFQKLPPPPPMPAE